MPISTNIRSLGQLTLNQTVNVSGVSATSSVGSLGVALAVIPQGQSGTISQGAATVQAGALVIPAGVTSATAVGSPSISTSAVAIPTGLAAVTAVGSPTISGTATVIPTGQSMQSNVGTVAKYTWREVDDAATMVWSEAA